jgi:hypothetical protein
VCYFQIWTTIVVPTSKSHKKRLSESRGKISRFDSKYYLTKVDYSFMTVATYSGNKSFTSNWYLFSFYVHPGKQYRTKGDALPTGSIRCESQRDTEECQYTQCSTSRLPVNSGTSLKYACTHFLISFIKLKTKRGYFMLRYQKVSLGL